jgi:hypothetical protein
MTIFYYYYMAFMLISLIYVLGEHYVVIYITKSDVDKCDSALWFMLGSGWVLPIVFPLLALVCFINYKTGMDGARGMAKYPTIIKNNIKDCKTT